ncbi:unnamed protein product [Arabidopsis thaliana]|uniref:Uncharacterized protein n=1 Tax=Arabidopsis thaliana TaxID=3702 RepID=A0A654F4P1_ARATH|nr:unnamed protein product [Arabidopsis thaliana]
MAGCCKGLEIEDSKVDDGQADKLLETDELLETGELLFVSKCPGRIPLHYACRAFIEGFDETTLRLNTPWFGTYFGFLTWVWALGQVGLICRPKKPKLSKLLISSKRCERGARLNLSSDETKVVETSVEAVRARLNLSSDETKVVETIDFVEAVRGARLNLSSDETKVVETIDSVEAVRGARLNLSSDETKVVETIDSVEAVRARSSA